MAAITKDKIIDVADELFSKDGVREVSIDDICRKLCISKKTFYQFYSQKEDLVGDVVTKHVDLHRRQFEKMSEGKGSAEVLMAVFDNICRKREKGSGSSKRLAQEIRKYYPDTFLQHTAERNRTIHDFLADCLRKGIEDGLVRKDVDVDGTLLLIRLMHIGMVDYFEGEVPVMGKKLPVKSVTSSFEDIVVNSILSRKGMEEYSRLREEKLNKAKN